MNYRLNLLCTFNLLNLFYVNFFVYWIQEKENLYEFMIIIRNFDYNLQIIFGNSDLISIFLFLFKILLIIIL